MKTSYRFRGKILSPYIIQLHFVYFFKIMTETNGKARFDQSVHYFILVYLQKLLVVYLYYAIGMLFTVFDIIIIIIIIYHKIL